ncbi:MULTISPECIES: RNA polymerase sigma factor [Niastella]|uniref:RNA polymerase sigma-70 factor n=1 Tax=Niastella soli TaxID=2821487 RepID=A0ABS3Z4D4_9BACT|nr:RNA polymerase sigma-70 factor [Niastella soli]MBO9204999.1 RNA polymerase sigma-70 factor [Niastella soli]
MRNLENLVTEKSKRLKQQRIPEFEKVFQLFHPALCFFARRLVNDPAIAQDIVTDVFVKLWQKQDDFKTMYSAKAFLYISTRNACLNHNHKVHYQSRIRENIRQQSTEVELHEMNEAIHTEVVNQVYNIVKDLPEKCKEVMLLSYNKGLDCHEIARRMQLSVHTVRNQKNRGVHLIKNRFNFREELVPIL